MRATAGTRLALELLVHRHRVTRLLDAPCGGSRWWPPLLARIRTYVPCFEYLGMDVVPSVVSENAKKFADDPLTNYVVGELATVDLPTGFDLVLCRDALQHLPLLDGLAILENIARARPRLVAVGSYPKEVGNPNKDVAVGGYFHVNVLLPPYNMSEPMDALDELSTVKGEQKFLLVYSGEYLAKLPWAAMRAAAVAGFGAVKRG